MNGSDYRVRITAKEKVNSDVLYIVDAEVLPTQKGNAVANTKNVNPNISTLPSDISIPELVSGVKIYDYNMKQNKTYTHADVS
jgi:hypothetical protein